MEFLVLQYHFKASKFLSETEVLKLMTANGLYFISGIAPRVIKVAPACAIMITIYESGKSFFRNRNDLIQNSKGISDMLSV